MFFLCYVIFSLQKNVFRMLCRGFMQGCVVLREFCILKKYFLSVGTGWHGFFSHHFILSSRLPTFLQFISPHMGTVEGDRLCHCVALVPSHCWKQRSDEGR